MTTTPREPDPDVQPVTDPDQPIPAGDPDTRTDPNPADPNPAGPNPGEVVGPE